MEVDYKGRSALRKAQMEELEGNKPSEKPSEEQKSEEKSRVQVCLSLTPQDKRALQEYARSQGATTSGIVTKWIHEQLG